MTELDSLDRRLLSMMQQDARLPAEEMGASIGLSGSAVLRRLKRLRDLGVIEPVRQ